MCIVYFSLCIACCIQAKTLYHILFRFPTWPMAFCILNFSFSSFNADRLSYLNCEIFKFYYILSPPNLAVNISTCSSMKFNLCFLFFKIMFVYWEPYWKPLRLSEAWINYTQMDCVGLFFLLRLILFMESYWN